MVGQSDLADKGGFNAHLDHAQAEGGARNGVLTAIEDFVKASKLPWSFTNLPPITGLGVLAPVALLEADAALRTMIDKLTEPPALQQMIELVEQERISSEVLRQEARHKLTDLRASVERAAAKQPESKREAELERELRSAARERGARRRSARATRERAAPKTIAQRDERAGCARRRSAQRDARARRTGRPRPRSRA